MKRNTLAKLLVTAAALNFSGCGGAPERSGDGKANGATPVAAASPAPTADVAAVNTSVNVAPAGTATNAAPAGVSTATQVTTPASGSRAAAAPQAKMPTPQVGSGGNDLFVFTQARAALNTDPELKAANLIIEVKEGVVTLSGTVASAALKSKAEELARGAGSKAVRNQLRVAAGK